MSSLTIPSKRDRDDIYVAHAMEEDSLYDQYQFYSIALISRQNIRSVHTIISSGEKSENNREDLNVTRDNVAMLFSFFLCEIILTSTSNPQSVCIINF